MSLSDSQSALFSKVDTALKLKLTSYGADRNAWTEGSFSGSCERHEEKLGGKLTGVSKNTLKGPEGLESVTLNCWMAPAYSIPHMLLTMSCAGSEFSVSADYVIRGKYFLITEFHMENTILNTKPT